MKASIDEFVHMGRYLQSMGVGVKVKTRLANAKPKGVLTGAELSITLEEEREMAFGK